MFNAVVVAADVDGGRVRAIPVAKALAVLGQLPVKLLTVVSMRAVPTTSPCTRRRHMVSLTCYESFITMSQRRSLTMYAIVTASWW